MLNNCKFRQQRVQEGQDNAGIESAMQNNPNATAPTNPAATPASNTTATSEQFEEVLSCRCCPCMNGIEKHEIKVAIDFIRFIVGVLSVVIFALAFSEDSQAPRNQ